MKILKLKYGNTNTYYIPGTEGGLLVDTDYVGTLPGFYRALKANGLTLKDVSYVMATHYHPDHMGIIGELTRRGVRLLLLDTQLGQVHFSDRIFARDGLRYEPIDVSSAISLTCGKSRAWLAGLGIAGEIIATASHSVDSVSVILDGGEAIVGDLEPLEYLAAYDENPALKKDWELIMGYEPRIIYYSHINEKHFNY